MNLTFEKTKNIYDYSPIMPALVQDFWTNFYVTLLKRCSIIPDGKLSYKYSFREIRLVKYQGKTIGICGLYNLKHALDSKELFLERLGLLPEYRNKHTGVKLLEFLYGEARKAGCERMLSFVSQPGKPLPFYLRNWFQVVSHVKEYCQNHPQISIEDDFAEDDDYVIAKEL